MYPYYETLNNEKSNYFNAFSSINMNFPPHLHNSVEMICVKSGQIEVTINDNTYLMEKGAFAISFPNDIHSYKTYTESEINLVIFSPEIAGGYFNKRSNKTPINPFLDVDNMNNGINNLLQLLMEEVINDNNSLVIKGYLYSILGKLENCYKFKQSTSYNYAIQSLLSYIGQHYKEKLTLSILASKIGFSKFYISRLFNNKIGYSLTEYVSKLRINMAEALLLESDMTIVNIAFECGFDSYRNFDRVFKEFTGTTPSEYRASGKF